MLPNLVIIGAQKSASTFLQACLREHPDVYITDGEIAFFEDPDYEETGGDIGYLENLFVGRTEKLLGIKRPSYIGRPEVPKRIKLHLPDAKIIAVLRNPVHRAVSAYFHYINYGFIPPINIETGMRHIIAQSPQYDNYKRSREIIEFGYYYKYLVKYEHYFANGQMLVLLQEDISSDPMLAYQKMCAFLDVNSSFMPKAINSRPQAVTYNLTRLKLLRLRNNFLYNYNTDRTRLFSKKISLSGKFMVGILTMIDSMILSFVLGNEKPKLSTELKNLLYDKYASDIEELEHLVGLNLNIWKPNNEN